MEGVNDVLGMWAAESERAKFQLSILNELKNRGSLPNDEAMFKLLYLALSNISKKWTTPTKEWKSALDQLA